MSNLAKWAWCKRLALAAGMLAVCAHDLAWGQGFGPTPRPGGGGFGSPPPPSDTPSGPAEAAPEEEEEAELSLPPLPSFPASDDRRLQFFELDGYFRFRADMFHNLSLGQRDLPGLRAPFFSPVSEDPASTQRCADRRNKPVPGGGDRELSDDDCPGNTLGGANLRLRLEPTINVAETVRVRAQIDLLDNLEMGSTPSSGAAGDVTPNASEPLAFLSESQAAPVVGENATRPSILVKRAWAEVDTPVGTLKFGRMPFHWGMGLMANDGNCWDCNYGDNYDRVSFSTRLAGYTLAMGYDFAASGPTSLTVGGGLPYYHGQVVDLEQLDDVDQLFWVLGQIDEPHEIEAKLERDEMVVNYGLYLTWRKQDFDYAPAQGLQSTRSDLAAGLIERHAWSWTPDLWFKFLYDKLSVEFEGVLVAGKLENASDEDATLEPLSIFQYGLALNSQYRFLSDALKVGLEVGMASGDSAEPADSDFNRRRMRPLADPSVGDDRLTEFRFDYDYLVDLILFRELLGTVANAAYFKPSISYDLLQSLGARMDVIYSLAHRPIAFPGNATNLGLEFDWDIYYKNIDEGFYAGVQYGLLIPFGALDRPAAIYGSDRAKKAELAQTLQARLIVKF